jgi:hypothetical protein
LKAKLTNKFVSQVKHTAIEFEIYDTDLNGFYLKVFSSGAKVFLTRYRTPDGKRHKLKIGRADALTSLEAREQAKKILAEVAIGKDPKAPRYAHENKIPTLADFVRDHYASWCEAHLQWSVDQLKKISKFTEFLKVPLDQINPQQVEKWRSETLKKGHAPSTVNRNIAVLRAVLSKSVEWGVIELHPLRRLKQLKVDRSPNVRYLSEDEEKRLRLALDEREAKLRVAINGVQSEDMNYIPVFLMGSLSIILSHWCCCL